MHESLWSQTAFLPSHAPLARDIKADVAVIGAGMTGVLTAYMLAQRGLHVAVLEADRIGSGQTGGTTAKITSQHGVFCDAFIRRFGEATARAYAQANQEAVEAYDALVTHEKIDCAFERTQSYVYSTTAAPPMEQEAYAARTLDLPAQFVRRTELPFPVRGAVCFDRQACFHPLRFLGALSAGLEIYEQTRVTHVEDGEVFACGHTVRADHVVFASHYPFPNVPGYYFLRMHQERSSVLALADAMLPRGLYLGADADGLSFRQAEGLLLLGGGGHRTGENAEGGRYAMLRARAKALFPRAREVACWSAQDCMTLDGMPYIGAFSTAQPRWLVATGFGKWGMTSAMVAAQALTGIIIAQPPAWAQVFSPARFHLSASAQSLAQDTVQAFKGIALEALYLPEDTAAALPSGHGGLVNWSGRKAGVYRDEHGRLYAVNPRCPHLGCELTWNPDETSWDCPCHGSRFSYDGTPLDGPAQTPLCRMDSQRGS